MLKLMKTSLHAAVFRLHGAENILTLVLAGRTSGLYSTAIMGSDNAA
jgi:hypothetical protein